MDLGRISPWTHMAAIMVPPEDVTSTLPAGMRGVITSISGYVQAGTSKADLVIRLGSTAFWGGSAEPAGLFIQTLNTFGLWVPLNAGAVIKAELRDGGTFDAASEFIIGGFVFDPFGGP
jgi:hypothetical protein